MLKNTKKVLLVLASLIAGTFVVYAIARAQVSVDLPTTFAGFGTQNIKVIIENIVRIVLGFVGVVFIVLVLYGGLVWMTSAGEEDKIARAKKILVSATTGLVITLAAYALASFIIRSINIAVGPDGGGLPGGGPPGGFALGAGALESHYPGRNAVDVPRNTNIFITWKEKIQVDTMCPGASVGSSKPLDIAAVEISDVNSVVPTGDANNAGPDNILEGVVCAPIDASGKTFKFDPPALLGISNGNTLYRVRLTDKILKDDGKTALPLGYSWQFTVSNIVDETPPQVTSVYPANGQTVPRNSIVQINFSEAVDPSLASGIAPPFVNITLSEPGPIQLDGSYISGNQYLTTEFVSNELCGQNSCGGNVYCLPAPASPPPATLLINGVVTSAITDMAGNFLDGDGDGTAGGNYAWSFSTNNTIDLTPPMMLSRQPVSGAAAVDLSNPIEMTFSKVLSASTLNSGNVGLGRTVPYSGSGLPDPITNEGNYWISSLNADTNGDGIPDQTKVFINHDTFSPLIKYHPGADAEVKDVQQNCYYPSTCGPGPC